MNEILDRVEREDVLGARVRAAGRGVKDRRESVTEDLRRTRDAAEKRLAEVLTALETIRLGLLRMHAGAGSVESMTADLTSARELSEDTARLLEGQREVDDLLNPGTATGEVVQTST